MYIVKKMVWLVFLGMIGCIDFDFGYTIPDISADNETNIGNDIEEKEYLEKAELARSGAPVDFDNDGFAETQASEDENGVLTVKVSNPNNKVYFLSTIYPDGRKHVLYDSNRDGRMDEDEHWTLNPFQKTGLYDLDFDGYPEKRVIMTADPDGIHGTQRVEFDRDGDGTYVLESEWHGELSFRIVTSEEETKDRAPKKNNSKTKNIDMNKAQSLIDVEGCKEHGPKLKKALDCALSGMTCLANTNNKIFNEFNSFLVDAVKPHSDQAGKFVRSGMIECEKLTSPSTGAETKFSKWAGNMIKIKFNTKIPSPTSEEAQIKPEGLRNCDTGDSTCLQKEEDELCNMMIHELIHASRGHGDEPADHNNGVDEIYSCARYCAKCSNAMNGAPNSPNVDCARCGGTIDEKFTCGFFETMIEKECMENDGNGFCQSVQDGGCVRDQCKTCRYIYENTCEKQNVTDLEMVRFTKKFWCCSACPESCGADARISDKCIQSNQFNLKNTCKEKPPMCPYR